MTDEMRPNGRGSADDGESAYQAWLQDRAELAVIRAGVAPEDAPEVAASLLVDFTGVDTARGDRVDQAAVLEKWEVTGEMDAVDLLGLDLPPIRTVVPGILMAGTTVLAAPPKIGKSILCYQLACEVALGGEFLGQACSQGAVLYLALEDGKRRGQDRLRSALRGRRLRRGALTVRWAAPTIGAGLEEEISGWLDAHGDAALVMIDTIQHVRGVTDGRRNAYEVDVHDVSRLQAITRDRPDVAQLFVHHTKKDVGDDFVAQVSGTYGIAGSADAIMLVKRKRHMELGVLEITGREMAEAELPVRFAEMHWELAPAGMGGMSVERLAVYEVVRAHGPIFPAAIASSLGSERSRVQHLVRALEADGLVVRVVGGYIVHDPSVGVDGLAHSVH